MTRSRSVSLRFIMLAACLTSVAMTWGILLSGETTAYQILKTYNPGLTFAAILLGVIGSALAAVRVFRHDPAGLVGLSCGVAVLSGTWALGIPTY